MLANNNKNVNNNRSQLLHNRYVRSHVFIFLSPRLIYIFYENKMNKNFATLKWTFFIQLSWVLSIVIYIARDVKSPLYVSDPSSV